MRVRAGIERRTQVNVARHVGGAVIYHSNGLDPQSALEPVRKAGRLATPSLIVVCFSGARCADLVTPDEMAMA